MRNTRIGDVPPFHCFVRKEFLYGGLKRNEYEECIVIGAVVRKDMALCFTVLLESGALWYELPLHALTMVQGPRTYSLPELQMWDCLSDVWTVHRYDHLRHLDVKVVLELEDGKKVKSDGRYLFTIDMMDAFYADHPAEHKTFNIIALWSGEIVAYPNNRCIFEDKTFTKVPAERPQYVRTSAHYFAEMPTSAPEIHGAVMPHLPTKPLVEEVAEMLAAADNPHVEEILGAEFLPSYDDDLLEDGYGKLIKEVDSYSLQDIRDFLSRHDMDFERGTQCIDDDGTTLLVYRLYYKNYEGSSWVGKSKVSYTNATRKAICRFLHYISKKAE